MIIYLIIALAATLLGAGAGMGGGVIIKPLMDLMGDYSVTEISVFASFTVFSMAVFATHHQVKKGFKITKTLVGVTFGAVVGGIAGSALFSALISRISPELITAIQSAVLILLLIVCLFYEHIKTIQIKSTILIMLIGAALGLFSAFLGIGGGPINVAALCILLGLELRIATRASIFIILFSQAASLLTKMFSGALASISDYTVLLYMIPAAIIGGLIGTKLNQSLTDTGIKWIIRFSVVLVILVLTYNFTVALNYTTRHK